MRKHELKAAVRSQKSGVRMAVMLIATLCLHVSGAEGQTTLYLRDSASPLGTLSASGAGLGCYNATKSYPWRQALTTSGTEVSYSFAPTSTAPPCLVQTSSDFLRWISPPLASSVNLTGNYDYQGKCKESSTSTNAGFRFVVYRWSGTLGGINLTLDSSSDSTECGTSAGNKAIAAHAPACGSICNLAVGDRIVVEVQVRNVGGSWGGNSSRTFTLYIEGVNSFAHFAQTLSFSSDSTNARALVFP